MPDAPGTGFYQSVRRRVPYPARRSWGGAAATRSMPWTSLPESMAHIGGHHPCAVTMSILVEQRGSGESRRGSRGIRREDDAQISIQHGMGRQPGHRDARQKLELLHASASMVRLAHHAQATHTRADARQSTRRCLCTAPTTDSSVRDRVCDQPAWTGVGHSTPQCNAILKGG
jgi:hypothetical protein